MLVAVFVQAKATGVASRLQFSSCSQSWQRQMSVVYDELQMQSGVEEKVN